LLSEDLNSPEVQDQLKLFQGQENEFMERKLLVIRISPTALYVIPERKGHKLSP
jgi:hypothetical protein